MFGRVDCESEQEIAQRFHITKYPTLKMWRNAQVKHHCYNYFYDCMLLYICVMQQPNSPWALLERSRFKTWLGQCLVLGFSSLWSINEYPWIVKQAWWNAKGNLAMDQHSIQWGVVILLVSSCFGNWDKLQLGGLLCSQTDFTFIILSRHYPFSFVIQ